MVEENQVDTATNTPTEPVKTETIQIAADIGEFEVPVAEAEAPVAIEGEPVVTQPAAENAPIEEVIPIEEGQLVEVEGAVADTDA